MRTVLQSEGTIVQFSDLHLSEPLLRAVAHEGYHTPTPIQVQAIPHVLAGRDLVGCAQTGTGKTAAFALPILQRLSTQVTSGPRRAKVLVLCPTRELATQIDESFGTYGRHLQLRHTTIFGGVGQKPQVDAVRRGLDVIVATPGRLLDLMNQGHVDLAGIQVLVLDEADRMLDMGFIPDIRRIVAKVPTRRQTLLFSATMPAEIRELAHALLHDPAQVQVAPPAATADGIDQSLYFVNQRDKSELLAHLVRKLPMTRALVFTRTKRGADRVVRHLLGVGIRAEAIHGNKAQGARERALENFSRARIPLLVATDIASRGIDVEGITHVVNFDLSDVPEVYVHRVGRTARAGATGAAVSFCDIEEVENLRAIERLLHGPIPVRTDAPQCVPAPIRAAAPPHGGNRPRPGPVRPIGTTSARPHPTGAHRAHEPREADRAADHGHRATPRTGSTATPRSGTDLRFRHGGSDARPQAHPGRRENGRRGRRSDRSPGRGSR